jgi:hypothetical protein
MTLMVPLGNVAFTLPFVPEHQGLRVTDIIGLVVICGGLLVYRFAADAMKKWREGRERYQSLSDKEPLLDLVNDADRVISQTEEG